MAHVIGTVEKGLDRRDDEELENLKDTIRTLEKDLAVEKQMVKDENETHRKVGLFALEASI